MKADVLRHYDLKYAAESEAPSRRIVAPSPYPLDRYEACLAAFVPRFRGGDVLELGSGSGLVARSLLATGAALDSYTASEISSARLAGLRASLDDPRVRVAELDIEHTSSSDEAPDDSAYDAVIMIALIEHLFDPLRAMQRVHALLRPGGFAIVDTPNVAKYTRRLKLLFGRFPSTASRDEGLTTYSGARVDLHDEGHLHYFTYRSLSRLLVDRCGFSRVERVPYASGRPWLGRRVHHGLARLRPELFGELCLVAYA